MKGKLWIIPVIFLTMLCSLSACARSVSIIEFDITRVMPSSLHDVNGAVNFNVQNGNKEMDITSASGVLYHRGNTFGTFTVNPFTIPGKCTAWVEVSGGFHLDENVSLATLLGMFRNFDMDEFTVDYSVKAKSGIFNRNFKGKNLSVKELLKGAKQ